MAEKNITCIICPIGCEITVQGEGDRIDSITGNTCKRGEEYGRSECLHPVRTVTAVVRVSNRPSCALSVKTAQPIPKEHIFDLMAILRGVTVSAPVAIGEIICDNVFGTQIIATGSVE